MLRSGSTKVLALAALVASGLTASCDAPMVLPSGVPVVTAGTGGSAGAGTGGSPGTGGGLDAGGGGDVAGADAGSDALGCDPSVTYATFGERFFTRYCRRCHPWDQSTAQQSGPLIAGVAGPGGFMPPGNPLPTDAERARLVSWIACGAP